MKKLKLEKFELTASYGPPERGWETVYIRRDEKEIDGIFYENHLAAGGYWLNSDDLDHLLELWKLLLRPGDELVVKSTKDRGSARGTPDCIWKLKLVESN